MTESFAQLFEESLKEIETRPGSIVRGVVVAIDKDVVLVDAGLKSESAIPAEQFKNAQGELEIQVGDEVDVALDAVEDGFGETLLSREKAKRHEAWITLEKAYEDAETVTGVINGKVKGGFTVELNGIRAFLPGSLVDVRPVRDTLHLEGKELEFKVIKLDQKRNNVVVSRRAVIESENSAERDQLLENLQEGMEVKGIVKNLTDYGAFVDLGGVDGLLHITDMAWKRVKHPSEIVNVGDEITVKVLKFDRERTRVSLGLKQLGEDPWVAIAKRYPEGTKLTGRVTNLTDYGCFVEIEEGVEPHADAGVEQLQVDDVFDRRALLSRIVEHRVVEPVVERVEVVASGEQDAELFAREGRVHALPVADELDVGVPFSVVLRQHAVHAVVEEAFRLGEECRRIVVVVHHVAREDTGRGRHLGRLELVVEDGFDLRKIGRFLGSEILDHVRGDDQRVFLVPPDADTGRQPGREVRARFDVQSRHGELVAAEFLVVEIHFEIGSQQNLLCVSCGDAFGKGEQE